MVDIALDNYGIHGVYKPAYNWGPPSCRNMSIQLFFVAFTMVCVIGPAVSFAGGVPFPKKLHGVPTRIVPAQAESGAKVVILPGGMRVEPSGTGI